MDPKTDDLRTALPQALIIAAIWGFNFVVIKVGVASVPPLLLAALRFLFSALPGVFFIKRPAIPWKYLAAYGLLLGVGQFGFLFTAIKLGAPAGLSSIILQSQALFTALLSALILKEGLGLHNYVGMALATLGLGLIAFGPSGGGGIGISGGLVAMILLAALGWAGANTVARLIPPNKGQGASSLGLMVWSSLFSPLPLLGLSLALEGGPAISASLRHFSLLSLAALAYLVGLSTLLAYGLWNRLIMRYGAGRIAPFSLFVPVFGLLSSYLVLGEGLGPKDIGGGLAVLVGLLIHVKGRNLFRRGLK